MHLPQWVRHPIAQTELLIVEKILEKSLEKINKWCHNQAHGHRKTHMDDSLK
jgi:hypothetical protein